MASFTYESSLSVSGLEELTEEHSRNWNVDLKKVIEMMPGAVCALDGEGLICFTNSRFFNSIAHLGRLKDRDFIQSIIHSACSAEVLAVLMDVFENLEKHVYMRTVEGVKTIIYKSPAGHLFTNILPVPLSYTDLFFTNTTTCIYVFCLSPPIPLPHISSIS